MHGWLFVSYMCQLDISFDVVRTAGHLVTLHMVCCCVCIFFVGKSNLSHAGLEIEVVYLHAVVCYASVA